MSAVSNRISVIDRAVNRVPMPLAYADQLYMFRQNINLVRQRVLRALRDE